MLVKACKNFRNQISINNVYLVIEIIVNISRKHISFRVIDDEDYPAIYDAENFIIVFNHINHFSILIRENSVTCSHEFIVNSKLNEKHIDGFWGLYIEDDVEAITILDKVIEDLKNEKLLYSKQ